jgi:hypothetical protein
MTFNFRVLVINQPNQLVVLLVGWIRYSLPHNQWTGRLGNGSEGVNTNMINYLFFAKAAISKEFCAFSSMKRNWCCGNLRTSQQLLHACPPSRLPSPSTTIMKEIGCVEKGTA